MKRIATVLALAACAALSAWGGPADDAHPHDKRVDPRSLPGDNLPPFGMLDERGRLVPMPAEFVGRRHEPTNVPESKVPSPTLDVAIAAARAAVTNCTSRGYLGAATVVDSAGEARAMLSADGADGSHVFVAQRKAITAVAFETSSAQARDMVAKDPTLLKRVTPAMFVNFGAFPIVSKGLVIGAIGYSGGDDEACARAGLAAIEAKLE
jgi:uncharacterized protein GlcG (DUF336 family)